MVKRYFNSAPLLIRTFIPLITLSQLLYLNTKAFAEDSIAIETDEGYVPVFRSGHNLSIFYSAEYSKWDVSQKISSSSNQKISAFQSHAINSGLFLRYSYHINLISRFGFFVGTTTGFLTDFNLGSNTRLLQSHGYLFPSILGGLTYNLAKSRILAGIEYSAVWYKFMNVKTDADIVKNISPVPDMICIFLGLDYFFKKNKAFSFQSGWRLQQITPLNNNSSATYLNTLSIKNNSYFAGFGITFQIGDINSIIN
ncbi:hypothetical protein [Spirobacillus cienkowskii]|jgi:hypothetical protein|uniref:Outer membrane protein beta-barrel domain-containing protein n=1 Tax=Spirobacillus cienkowskii TaxID=495820 RepID=A0A369KQV9_9BACT|nr:MAG: hypothetical protein DCC88_06405 [Spirobacillus cienkowskii]